MEKNFSKNNLVSYIFTAAVIIALITLSIIQYKWLITSSEKDLMELYKNMNFKIYRNFSTELESEFYNFNNLFMNPFNSEDDIRDTIKDSFGDYIVSISYINEEKLHIFNGTKWSTQENSYIRDRKMGDFIPYENGIVKIYFPIKMQAEILGVIDFDIESFFNDRVKNNLLTDEYELKWYFKQPKSSNVINQTQYKYSPINFILNSLLNREEKWLFGVSLHIEFRRTKEMNLPTLLLKPRFPDEFGYDNLYVEVLINGKSLVKSKETYITFQWLFSLVLLLGMGISYIYILNQIRNLRSLRKREKIFVATVTHELRTPLTVIHSAADNIEKGILGPEKLVKYGSLIKDQSKRLTSMVEGILLFSRLEGKMEKPPLLKATNLLELINEIEGLYPNVTIENYLDISILSDKDTITHILTNLLTNAINHAYSPLEDGSIRLKIQMHLPKKIIFTIEDDGIGIDKKDLKHIFKPFYRSKLSYDKQVKGSGLGLFIAFTKVKLLNGNLTVDSPYERSNGEIRKGCRFIVSIPYIPIESRINNE